MNLIDGKRKYGDFMLHAIGLINESLTIAKELRDDGYWVQLKRVSETEAEVYKSIWKKDLEAKYGVPRFDEAPLSDIGATSLTVEDRSRTASRYCPRCNLIVKEPTAIEDTELENHKNLRYNCPHCRYIFCEGVKIS